MPRKPLIYTHEYPYHVCARSNNREWFYLNKQDLWHLFCKVLIEANREYKLQIHNFVLMDNHYHMLVSTGARFPLGQVMQFIQRSVAREANIKTGRINHFFGGPYKGSLVRNPIRYADVFKYVYRNPIEANIVKTVSEYPYSTFVRPNDLPLSSHAEFSDPILFGSELENWLNQKFQHDEFLAIQSGLKRTEFKPIVQRAY